MAKYIFEYVQEAIEAIKEALSGGKSAGSSKSGGSASGSVSAAELDAVSGAGVSVSADSTHVAPADTEDNTPSRDAPLQGDTGQGPESGGRSARSAPKSEESALKKELKNLDERIELAINRGDLQQAMQLQTQAQERIAQLVTLYEKRGFSEKDTSVAALLNRGYDYANDQDKLYQSLLEQLTDALTDLTKAAESTDRLLEKQQAAEDARSALENAQQQRTVRVYNSRTEQWEWLADESLVSNAEKALEKAETALRQERLSQELAAVQAAAGSGSADITLGSELLALLGGSGDSSSALDEQISAVLGAVSALGALSAEGVDGYGAALTGSSLFESSSVSYNFGGITLSSAEAESMTIAELARRLGELTIEP